MHGYLDVLCIYYVVLYIMLPCTVLCIIPHYVVFYHHKCYLIYFQGLAVICPSFIIVGLATQVYVLYLGLVLYAFGKQPPTYACTFTNSTWLQHTTANVANILLGGTYMHVVFLLFTQRLPRLFRVSPLWYRPTALLNRRAPYWESSARWGRWRAPVARSLPVLVSATKRVSFDWKRDVLCVRVFFDFVWAPFG